MNKDQENCKVIDSYEIMSRREKEIASGINKG